MFWLKYKLIGWEQDTVNQLTLNPPNWKIRWAANKYFWPLFSSISIKNQYFTLSKKYILNNLKKYSNVFWLKYKPRGWVQDRVSQLTLNLPTWKIWWAANNAGRCQMGFNSAFKGLITEVYYLYVVKIFDWNI